MKVYRRLRDASRRKKRQEDSASSHTSSSQTNYVSIREDSLNQEPCRSSSSQVPSYVSAHTNLSSPAIVGGLNKDSTSNVRAAQPHEPIPLPVLFEIGPAEETGAGNILRPVSATPAILESEEAFRKLREQNSRVFHPRSISTSDLNDHPHPTVDPSDQTADTINYDLIKLWIQSCENLHGSECRNHGLGGGDHTAVDIILLDVQKNCLVQSLTNQRYFALSYVWGAVQQLQTTNASWQDFQEEGILSNYYHLTPQIIQDAIEVVRRIGERYLWIDSLCIVQDDAAIKHHQISHMAAIYSSAIACIVAVSARDASSNLPGVRPGTRWPRQWGSSRCELSTPLRPDLVLKAIDRSLYASRGWTFQERLLSRRCIYFLDEQVYFQCTAAVWCEEAPAFSIPSGFALRFKHDLSKMARVPHWVRDIQAEKWDAAFAFYAELMVEYSRKSLSFPHDIMDALAGIVNVLEASSGWTFLYGMPAQFLDWALLWVPIQCPTARRTPASLSPGNYFPSWSFVGWMGAVNFHAALDTELRDLKSAVSRFEVLDMSQQSGFRPVPRAIIEKRRTRRNYEMEADFQYDSAHIEDKPPVALLLGNALRFEAQTIRADFFLFSDMGPWSVYLDTVYQGWGLSRLQVEARSTSENNNTRLQKGAWLHMKGESQKRCGFLYSVTPDQLPSHRWARLRLVLLSLCREGSAPTLLLRNDGDLTEIEDFSNFFTLKGESLSEARKDYGGWNICNIMLIERKGTYFERVAVGQLPRALFEAASPENTSIVLV